MRGESHSPSRPRSASTRAAHRWRVRPKRDSSATSRVASTPPVDVGRHGDDDRAGPVGSVVGPREAGDDRARQLEHQRGVAGGEREEGLDVEAGQGRLPQRRHRGRARRPLDQAHLADDLAATDLAAVDVALDDAEAPADDEIAGVGRIALGEQDVAGVEVDPHRQLDDLGRHRRRRGQQLGHELGGAIAVDAAPGQLGDLRQARLVGLQPALVALPRDVADRHRLEGPHGGGPGGAGKGRDLADERPGPDGADAVQVGAAQHLESPALDLEHVTPFVAFAHQDVAGREVANHRPAPGDGRAVAVSPSRSIPWLLRGRTGSPFTPRRRPWRECSPCHRSRRAGRR